MHLLQMLQHVWTYKPLVHDVLGMHANSITIEAKAEAGQLPGASSKKRYEVCPRFQRQWHRLGKTHVSVTSA